MPDLFAHGIEQRGDLEPFIAEARVVRERQPEVAGAHDGDGDAAVEAEDLPQVPPQLLHVVAHAAHAELAEVRQVLPDLGGVEVELLGEPLRRHRAHARRVERVQAAQIDREAVGRQLRDRLGRLRPARAGRRRRRRAGLVRLLHKLI